MHSPGSVQLEESGRPRADKSKMREAPWAGMREVDTQGGGRQPGMPAKQSERTVIAVRSLQGPAASRVFALL